MLQVMRLDFQLFNLVSWWLSVSSLIVVSEHSQYCIVGLYFDHPVLVGLYFEIVVEHFQSCKLHVFIVIYSSCLYI
jgi:hypothetical protein